MNDSKLSLTDDNVPDTETRPSARGVERIPLLLHGLPEEKINLLITRKVVELASNGKRVCGVPKRLQDGIALDWIRDVDVKVEHLDDILRKIGLKTEVQSSNAGDRAYIHTQPMVIDLVDPDVSHDGLTVTRPLAHRSISAPLHIRGPTSGPRFERASTVDWPANSDVSTRRCEKFPQLVNQFKLFNLSVSTTAETIRQSILAANVPISAILDIQVRMSPAGKFATVLTAQGYSAANVRRNLLGNSWRDMTNLTSSRSKDAKDPWDPSVSNGLADHDAVVAGPEVIDLTVEDVPGAEETSDPTVLTDMEISEDETTAPCRQDPSCAPNNDVEDAEDNMAITRDHDHEDKPDLGVTGDPYPIVISSDSERGERNDLDRRISPALSYLTIDEVPDGGHREPDCSQDITPSLPSPVANRRDKGRWLTSSSDELESSSEEDSIEHEDDIGRSGRILRPSRSQSVGGVESLATRLLDGTATVEDVMAETSAGHSHRMRDFIARATTSRIEIDTRDRSRRRSDRPIPKRSRCRRPDARPERPGLDRLVSQRRPISQDGSSSDEGSLDVRAQSRNEHSVFLPKAPEAKGRRLLVPPDEDLPMVAVYMRGDVQFIHQERREHIKHFSLPHDEEELRVVSDAAILSDNMVVVSYDRGPAQVSCITLNEKPLRIDLEHRGHSVVQEHRATGTSSPNPSISALTVLDKNRRRFLTGGGDGCIRLWTIRGGKAGPTATSEALTATYFQPVRCLAYSNGDRRVLYGRSNHICFADLDGHKSEAPGLLSAGPLQIHVHPNNPSVVILEVDHLDRQVQIFDLRSSNFSAPPCMEFGYRDTSTSIGRRTEYRYCRGSTRGALFARGYYGDGTVCVWDYRQPKNILKSFERRRESAITHTVLSGDQVIAYGGNHVSFWGLDMQSP